MTGRADLQDEFWPAQQAACRQADRLASYGIPAAVIRSPLLGVGRIVPEGETYQAHPDGEIAIMVGIGLVARLGADAALSGGYDWWAWIDDIVAWLPADPARWWRRTRAATLLGADPLGALPDGPLTLHATPLDWLRAGAGDGHTCVLEWGPSLRSQLRGRRITAGPETANRVRALWREGMPRIVTPPAPTPVRRSALPPRPDATQARYA